MYAYIKGVLADVEEESVVVEAGGIGYRIYTTGQTFDYLPAVGEEVKLYTYLNVREDAMILYGFLTKDDLRVFKLLIGVNGIGPKGALICGLRCLAMTRRRSLKRPESVQRRHSV